MQNPTLGRVVHFQDAGGAVASIVTAVHADGCVDLTTFPPGEAPVPVSGVEPAPQQPVVAGGDEAPQGTWFWPPRFTEAELKGAPR